MDAYAASLGHLACAREDAWVQGGYVDLVKAVSWHPLRAGMDAVAQLVHEKINGTDLAAGRLAMASSTEREVLRPRGRWTGTRTRAGRATTGATASGSRSTWAPAVPSAGS